MKTLSLSLAFTTLLMSSSAMAMDNKVQSENFATSSSHVEACQKALNSQDNILGNYNSFDKWMTCGESVFNPKKVTQKEGIADVCTDAIAPETTVYLSDKKLDAILQCRYSIANTNGYSLEAKVLVMDLHSLLSYVDSIKTRKSMFVQSDYDIKLKAVNRSISHYQSSDWPEKDALLKTMNWKISDIIVLKDSLINYI